MLVFVKFHSSIWLFILYCLSLHQNQMYAMHILLANPKYYKNEDQSIQNYNQAIEEENPQYETTMDAEESDDVGDDDGGMVDELVNVPSQLPKNNHHQQPNRLASEINLGESSGGSSGSEDDDNEQSNKSNNIVGKSRTVLKNKNQAWTEIKTYYGIYLLKNGNLVLVPQDVNKNHYFIG